MSAGMQASTKPKEFPVSTLALKAGQWPIRNICGAVFRFMLNRSRRMKQQTECAQFFTNVFIVNNEAMQTDEEWLLKVNRGGLLRISNPTYTMMKHMNAIANKFYSAHTIHSARVSISKITTKCILENTIIHSMFSSLWGDQNLNTKLQYLKFIINKFLAIKGNALARYMREKIIVNDYKLKKGKKALRASLKQKNAIPA